MLTLGIPAGAAMAIMLGALQIQGIAPGPGVMTDHPQLFWGLIASMWIGNMMLLVLNLPLIGVWVKLLGMPFHLLYPPIIAFSCIGVFSEKLDPFDILLAAGLGLLGVVFRVLGANPAPLILSVVLEPMLEQNFRRALILGDGDILIFLKNPISLGILLFTALVMIYFKFKKRSIVDDVVSEAEEAPKEA